MATHAKVTILAACSKILVSINEVLAAEKASNAQRPRGIVGGAGAAGLAAAKTLKNGGFEVVV